MTRSEETKIHEIVKWPSSKSTDEKQLRTRVEGRTLKCLQKSG